MIFGCSILNATWLYTYSAHEVRALMGLYSPTDITLRCERYDYWRIECTYPIGSALTFSFWVREEARKHGIARGGGATS